MTGHALLIGLFGWLIGCAAVLALFIVSAFFGWLFGSDKVDAGLAPLPTDDDEPLRRPVEPGCCPMHDAARERLRRFVADRAVVEFDPDAELAELLRGGQ